MPSLAETEEARSNLGYDGGGCMKQMLCCKLALKPGTVHIRPNLRDFRVIAVANRNPCRALLMPQIKTRRNVHLDFMSKPLKISLLIFLAQELLKTTQFTPKNAPFSGRNVNLPAPPTHTHTHPEGPARHLDVSGQKLSPHCLETIFDSQLPSPKLSPKMPPKLSLPHRRGHFFLFQNYPCG